MSEELGNLFEFCTTQNQNGLQGIEQIDDEFILVTFNKSVTKFKVIDQRPICSWNLNEGFSCAAVYDEKNSVYIAVTKSNKILSWEESATSLEKIKKNTVQSPILKVCIINGNASIVFQNGAIMSVEDALSNKKLKVPDVLPGKASRVFFEKDKLKEIAVFISSDCSKCWTVDDGIPIREIDTRRKGFQLLDVSFVENLMVTLWSDKQIFMLDFFNSEEFPGKCLGKIQSLNGCSKVSMTPMTTRSVALFGTNLTDSAGVIGVFNLNFKAIQVTRKIKSKESSPLVFGPFSSNLFIFSESQIFAAPINSGGTQLSALLGTSNCVDNTVEVLEWEDTPSEVTQLSVPQNLEATFSELLSQGLPENKISDILLPALMEKKDVASITHLLQSMKKVSEAVLAKLVSYCLRGEDQDFSDGHSDVDDCSASLPPESPLMGGRKRLLHLVLSKPFSAIKLLPEARRYISPPDAMLFIQHTAAQLCDGSDLVTDSEFIMNQMVQWISVLLDAHYQYCLLTCDQQVTTVLNFVLAVIDMQIAHTKELGKLRPLIEHVVKKFECESKPFIFKKSVFPMTDPNWMNIVNK
ncbi:nucleolar protein 11-like [Cloeon dipterum]|uniref:nucleolar protein 11-like n=1 Tax=Cloeon dipterum TaxID=197152 RepID=UPI00321FF895